MLHSLRKLIENALYLYNKMLSCTMSPWKTRGEGEGTVEAVGEKQFPFPPLPLPKGLPCVTGTGHHAPRCKWNVCLMAIRSYTCTQQFCRYSVSISNMYSRFHMVTAGISSIFIDDTAPDSHCMTWSVLQKHRRAIQLLTDNK